MEKARIVLSVLAGEMTVAEAARRSKVSETRTPFPTREPGCCASTGWAA
jgi:hypothetical protein